MLNLNTIYSTYYRKSFLFVKSYVQNDQLAEDITSDAIIALWEKSKETTLETPEAYLITCLRNKALNYLKQKQHHNETLALISDDAQFELTCRISSLEACDPQELLSKELWERINLILASLPDRTRLIFDLNRFNDKTYEEIAIELGMSVKGVEYHISKALKALRDNLKDYYYLLIFFI